MNLNLSKGQEYLLAESRKKIYESYKKIKELYSDYYNVLTTVPNNVMGLVIEDGVENKNPNYKIDLLSNIMHQIGYWEGIKAKSEMDVSYLRMNDRDFEYHIRESENIKKQNKIEIERIKAMLTNERLNTDGLEKHN